MSYKPTRDRRCKFCKAEYKGPEGTKWRPRGAFFGCDNCFYDWRVKHPVESSRFRF